MLVGGGSAVRISHFLFVGTCFLTPLSAEALTLNEAVDMAVKNHPRVQEAVQERRASDARLEQAQGRYLPKLDLSGFTGPQWYDRPESIAREDNREWRVAREATVSVRQVLFAGFDRSNEVYRRGAESNAAAVRVTQQSEQIALETVQAYVDAVRHRKILAIAERNIRVHVSYLGKIRTAFDGGRASRGEVEQASERLRGARALKGEVMQSLGEVEARLENLVGQPVVSFAPVTAPSDLPLAIGPARAEARRSNLTLIAAEDDLQAARFSVEQSKSAFFPEVALEGSATAGEDVGGTPGRNNNYSVGVNVRWNLYNGGVDTAAEREAFELFLKAQKRRDTIVREVEELIARTYTDIEANNFQLKELRAQERAAGRVVGAYAEEFDAGSRDFLDLLNAEASRFNTRIDIATAESVAIVARYRLLSGLGSLLQAFDVSPHEASARYDELPTGLFE